MKFALDTEFIDTPTCSALISLALVAEDDRCLYLEFPYSDADITPWLQTNVVPHLSDTKVTFAMAAALIRQFVGGSKFEKPEFYAYFGSYDWYWLCRVFGGLSEMPSFYPHRHMEWAEHGKVPDLFGAKHHALNDARSLMAALRAKGVARAT